MTVDRLQRYNQQVKQGQKLVWEIRACEKFFEALKDDHGKVISVHVSQGYSNDFSCEIEPQFTREEYELFLQLINQYYQRKQQAFEAFEISENGGEDV